MVVAAFSSMTPVTPEEEPGAADVTDPVVVNTSKSGLPAIASATALLSASTSLPVFLSALTLKVYRTQQMSRPSLPCLSTKMYLASTLDSLAMRSLIS